MRRKMAIGILGLMFLLGSAFVSRGQEGPQAGGDQGGPAGDAPHQFEHRNWQSGPGERHMGGPRDGMHRFGGPEPSLGLGENPRLRQYLGLTDDQVSRLHSIALGVEKARIQDRADLELRHLELRELMRADNTNRDTILQKLDQVITLEGKMHRTRVEALLSARDVLTPEQREKMKTFRENRGPGMRGPGAGQPHATNEVDGPEDAPEAAAVEPPPPPLEGE